MKKQKKKRKLRVGRLFLLLLILVVISFALFNIQDIKTRSIIITGNNILSDQDIIEISGLENYPSFITTLTFNVKKRLLENKYIKSAKVYKGILSFKIIIEEEKILYVDYKTNDKVTINSIISDNKNVCVPYLINDVPNDKKNYFLKAMSKINSNILCQMSEIKYDPNEIDEDRYFVYMNDGNIVYLTVNKFNKINKYNTILENVGKQNGILYLDYGDYFELK